MLKIVFRFCLTKSEYGYKRENLSFFIVGYKLKESRLLKEIVNLKRLKKNGFGEKSLFELLLAYRDEGSGSLTDFIQKNREKYGLNTEDIEYISNSNNADRVISISEHLNFRLSAVPLSGYPIKFLNLKMLPIFFYKGDLSLLEDKNIAVVGTRNPTSYGVEVAERLVKIISGNANIVSGGASGIDTVAHSSALKYGGKTVVFLGTAIDNPYPQVNIPLFDNIVKQGGLIISFYGPYEKTNEFTFVKRNQYIAESSDAVIVVEGGEKSGARYTAEYALKKSIPVFAVPGPIISEKSYCPNYLISKGAKIIYNENILVDFLGPVSKCEKAKREESLPPLDNDELSILEIFYNEKELHIDDIMIKSGKDTGELNEILLNMELKGIIEQLPGKIFRKRSF